MVDHIPAVPPSPRAPQPIQRRGDAGSERQRNAFQQAMEKEEDTSPDDGEAQDRAPRADGNTAPHHEPGEPGATLDIVV